MVACATKPDPVRPFDLKDAIYTLGNQWKQRYITKIGDELFILPAQYNLETGRWVPYHAHNWKERPWLKNCGGCHVTGLDYEKRTFVESGVGCEACHGPGDHEKARELLEEAIDGYRTLGMPRHLEMAKKLLDN